MSGKDQGERNFSAMTFLKSIVGFSLSTYIGAIITFVSVFINTRIFDTATLGKINLFITIQSILVFFAYLGLDQAFCRYYYECNGKHGQNKLFVNCLFLSLCAVGGLSLVVICIWRPLSVYINEEASFVVATCLLLSVATNTVCRYLSLLQRMQHKIVGYTIITVCIAMSNKLSYSMSSIIAKDSVTSISAIVIAYSIVTIIFGYLSMKNSSILISKIDFKDKMTRRALKFGIPLMPISLLSWLNSSLPTLLMKEMISYDAIGVYANAVVFTSAINLIQSGFNTFWVPFYYEHYKDQNARIKKMHDIINFLMVAFGILLILFKDVLFWLVGSNYKSGSIIFPFLLISPICFTIGETTGIGISISEKSYLHSIYYVFSIIVNLLLCWLLMPVIGIIGAAISVAIASVVILIVKTVIGEKYYKSINNYAKSALTILLLFISAIWDYYFKQGSGAIWGAGLISVLLLLCIMHRGVIRFCVGMLMNAYHEIIKKKV